MSMQENSSDFKAMNVAEFHKYFQDRGVSVCGYNDEGHDIYFGYLKPCHILSRSRYQLRYV